VKAALPSPSQAVSRPGWWWQSSQWTKIAVENGNDFALQPWAAVSPCPLPSRPAFCSVVPNHKSIAGRQSSLDFSGMVPYPPLRATLLRQGKCCSSSTKKYSSAGLHGTAVPPISVFLAFAVRESAQGLWPGLVTV